ncbi:MAG: hypothetical protein HOV81_30120 [Kofleriaceae bacterium]|nr:hypothetical protein [Kofleriaceae bacterium]
MRVALVALVLVLAGTASAANRTTGVAISGDGVKTGDLTAHLRTVLEARDYEFSDEALSKDATNTIANCFVLDDVECAKGVFDARGKTDTLVYARTEQSKGKTGSVIFTLYWFEKGRSPNGERRACENCTPATWHTLVKEMLGRLQGRPAKRRVARRSEEKPSRTLPAILLASGVAAIAAGGVFLYYGSRGGPNDKFIYPDSTPVGIALAAVGGGATIGGTVLLIQAGGDSSDTVASLPGRSFVVSWTGRF